MTVLLLLLEQEPELCWSRFVKEKGLQAGDVVGFFRSATAASDVDISGLLPLVPKQLQGT